MGLADGPSPLKLPELTETLIMSPRLSTLLRNVEVAQISSPFYVLENKYFVRTVEKKGNKRSQKVCRSNLNLTTTHLLRTKGHPLVPLVRHLNNLDVSTGADRVGKLAMRVMGKCDINTKIFEGNSLRGAAATYLLQP